MATYRTTDLNLAAALKTILRSNPTVQLTGRLAQFDFPVDPTEAKSIADAYYSDRLTGNLRTFASDLRDLKALIFAAREGGGR